MSQQPGQPEPRRAALSGAEPRHHGAGDVARRPGCAELPELAHRALERAELGAALGARVEVGPESRFSTFLYRVAVNAALNRRRSLGRRRSRREALERRQDAGEDLPQRPRGPEDAAAGGQIQLQVQRAIATLPPHLRVQLVLFDIEGLPYAEVASVLQVAEGTVKSRIHRARQALRERLRDFVEGPAAGEERAR